MLDFRLKVEGDFYFGKNAMEHLPQALNGAKKVMLLYGGGSVMKNGCYDSITSVLKKSGIEYVDFGGNTQALYSNVKKGVQLAIDEKVDCVIGIGGSTCMDMAKIVAFGAKHADKLWEYMTGEIQRDGNEDRLLIGAIPTFPSGGSEAGQGAGVDDDETGRSLDLYGYVPDFAILNPEFSYTLNPMSTALGAMVTFVQVSLNHMGGTSALSERITESVLDVIRESVEISMKDPANYEARANQMYCSLYGTNGIPSKGKDLSKSYEIYNYSGIMRKIMGLTYRENFVLFFPYWLKAAAKYQGADIKKYMVRVWGVTPALEEAEACAEGVNRILAYYEKLGLPVKYSRYGQTPDRDTLIKYINAEGIYNPMPMEEIIAMFEAAL